MSTPLPTTVPLGTGTRVRTREAALYIGLSPATLAKWRCLGGGPPFAKLGRAVVYELRDLDAWCSAKGKFRTTRGSAVFDARASP